MKQHTKLFAGAVAVTIALMIASSAQAQYVTGTPYLSNIDTTYLNDNAFGGWVPATFTSVPTGLEVSAPGNSYSGTYYGISSPVTINPLDSQVTFSFTFNSPAGPYTGGVNVQFQLNDSLGANQVYNTEYNNSFVSGTAYTYTFPITGQLLTDIGAGANINALNFYIDPANTGGAYDITENSLYLSPVPEPTTLALIGLGVTGFLAARRRKE